MSDRGKDRKNLQIFTPGVRDPQEDGDINQTFYLYVGSYSVKHFSNVGHDLDEFFEWN